MEDGIFDNVYINKISLAFNSSWSAYLYEHPSKFPLLTKNLGLVKLKE